MSLKIRLRPEKLVRIGKSIIRNIGKGSCFLLIDSPDEVMREDYTPKDKA